MRITLVLSLILISLSAFGVEATHKFDYRGLNIESDSPDGDPWNQFDEFTIEMLLVNEGDMVEIVNVEIELLGCGDTCLSSEDAVFLPIYYGIEFWVEEDFHDIYIDGSYQVKVCVWDYTEGGYQSGWCHTTSNMVNFEKAGSPWPTGSILLGLWAISVLMATLSNSYLATVPNYQGDGRKFTVQDRRKSPPYDAIETIQPLAFLSAVFSWWAVTYIMGYWQPGPFGYLCQMGCLIGLFVGGLSYYSSTWFSKQRANPQHNVETKHKVELKHKVEASRCTAITGSGPNVGGRCKLNAMEGSKFCHIHGRRRR